MIRHLSFYRSRPGSSDHLHPKCLFPFASILPFALFPYFDDPRCPCLAISFAFICPSFSYSLSSLSLSRSSYPLLAFWFLELSPSLLRSFPYRRFSTSSTLLSHRIFPTKNNGTHAVGCLLPLTVRRFYLFFNICLFSFSFILLFLIFRVHLFFTKIPLIALKKFFFIHLSIHRSILYLLPSLFVRYNKLTFRLSQFFSVIINFVNWYNIYYAHVLVESLI